MTTEVVRPYRTFAYSTLVAGDKQSRTIDWRDVERLVGRRRLDGGRHLVLPLRDGTGVDLPVLADRNDARALRRFEAAR